MNKKDNIENVVVKREFIDNSTIKEMNEKYPRVTVKGVAYDLGLTYITLQTDYFSDPNIRKLIKEYGAEIIAVICFFRMKMCQPHGWYCRVDGDSLDTLIEDCAYTLKMNEEKVKECYQALVDRKAFYVVSDESGEYLADTQQLFNFEILNSGRVRDRLRKQASRAKAKAEAEKEKAAQPKPISTAPAPKPVKEKPTVQDSTQAPTTDDLETPFDW